MNQTEALQLVLRLNRAGILQAMEGQSSVWHEALDDVDYDDAVEVARRLVRARTGADRWVTPGDIRAGVSQIRRERTATATAPAPPTEIADDVARTMAYQRAWMRGIGDGLTPDAADQRACAEQGIHRYGIERPRPVDKVVEQTAQAMPRIPNRERETA